MKDVLEILKKRADTFSTVTYVGGPIVLKIITIFMACFCFVGIPLASSQEPREQLAWKVGPLDIPLADQAVLHLPEGYRFLDAKATQKVLRDMGNFPSGEELGLITSSKSDSNWFTVLRYINAGYVKDDDAANWNAEEMLEAIKEGTAQDNEKRQADGIPLLLIKGWEEEPHYDATAHKVEWAISNRASSDKEGEGVNYNTLALGRYGYLSMNMVGDLKDLPDMKPHAKTLLNYLDFNEGKRYADFDSGTDKVAAVGLAALIAGAAFKTGLLGKLWAFLIPIVMAGKKLLVFIVIGAAALLRWWKKKAATATAPTTPTEQPPST